MKSVIVNIDEKYAGAMAITVAGMQIDTKNAEMNVKTHCIDVNKVQAVKFEEDGTVREKERL